MISDLKLRRLFLPLVGITGKLFKEYFLTFKKIAFKYKDIPYKRHVLYLKVEGNAFIEKFKTIIPFEVFEEGDNIKVIRFKCLDSKKEIWNKLIKGHYSKLDSWDINAYSDIYSTEEYNFLRNALVGGDEAYISFIKSKLSPSGARTAEERAKDLFESDKERFKSKPLLKKITLNSI